MPTRYKVIGKDGADYNDGDGYTLAKAEVEAEGWAEWDPDILIVPLNSPAWRSTHPDAQQYRKTAANRRIYPNGRPRPPSNLRKE